MEQKRKKQPYKYDNQVYIWSIVYSLAIILMGYGCFKFMDDQWWIAVLLIIVVLMTLYIIASLPRAYEETDKYYIVHMLLLKAKFSKEKYDAEPVDRSVLKNSVRTFATGGAFGYSGYWWSPSLKYFYGMFANVNLPMIKLTRKENKKGKRKVYLINGTLSSHN